MSKQVAVVENAEGLQIEERPQGNGRSNVRTTLLALGLVAGSYALKTYLAARARLEFSGKSVVITGGSRGLGLELARLFVADGAKVALLARDGAELGRAREELLHIAPHAEVLSVVCDVTSEDAVHSAIERVVSRFDTLDALVNVAGIIQVGPLEHMSLHDFDEAININLRGPLITTLASLPHLKRAARANVGHGGARIVNIASIGGIVALPHMAPYATSKFGLVGFSNATRAELAKDGVRVLTVCPSTIRTGSHVHAMFKGDHEKEYTAFAAAAEAPLVTMNASAAAREIYEAAKRGDDELLPGVARFAAAGAHWFPGVTSVASKLIARVMPSATDASGDELKTGAQSRSATPPVLTHNSDKASARNNEGETAPDSVKPRADELGTSDGLYLNGSHPAATPGINRDSNSGSS